MPKISPDLLSVLRCPVTGSTLVQEGDELVSTAAGESGEKLRYAHRGRHPAAAAAGTAVRRHRGAARTSTTAGTLPPAAPARASRRIT